MLRWLLVSGCALIGTLAGAQTPAALPQYPAGTITSVAQADQALRDAKGARLEQEKLFEAQRNSCYQKLLAEICLAPLRDENSASLRRIRSVEVEAREFKREQSARQAAAKRAEQRKKEAAQESRRREERLLAGDQQTKKIMRNAANARQFEADATQREQRAKAAQKRADERAAARFKKNAEERAKTAERADRARAQEDKVAEILRRAKEKEAKAREKAAKLAPATGALAGKL